MKFVLDDFAARRSEQWERSWFESFDEAFESAKIAEGSGYKLTDYVEGKFALFEHPYGEDWITVRPFES